MTRFAAAALALCLLAGAAGAEDPAREREWRHVRDVLFGGVAGSAYVAGRVARWRQAPVLAMFGAGPEDRAFVAATVERFNRALPGRGLGIAGGEPGAATIGIFFAPRRDMPAIAARYRMNRSMAMRGAGYTEAHVGSGHDLHLAVVLIRDELTGDERRATVVHELYHALGPGGHSRWIPASVVFEDGGMNSFATAPAPVDMKVLALLYRHLRPGADEADVRAAFDAHWSDLDPVTAAGDAE